MIAATARIRRLGDSIHAYAVACAGGLTLRTSYSHILPGTAHGPVTRLPLLRKTTSLMPSHGQHARDRLAEAAGVTGDLHLRLVGHEPRGNGYAVICPHASKPAREWRPERWAAVVEHLRGLGIAAKVCPDPARWTGDGVRCGLDVLADLMRGAKLVLAVDSGPIHLADLLGVPTVGLYGVTSTASYGPYNDSSHCIDRHRDNTPAGVAYDSARHWDSGMDAITADDVIEALPWPR
jgi:ADP-heptose:LPS heptosyltransferase